IKKFSFTEFSIIAAILALLLLFVASFYAEASTIQNPTYAIRLSRGTLTVLWRDLQRDKSRDPLHIQGWAIVVPPRQSFSFSKHFGLYRTNQFDVKLYWLMLALTAVVVLPRVYALRKHKNQSAELVCKRCGYNIQRLRHNVCPECGQTFGQSKK
ncbi:MAG TPA: hypothetical protein PK869_16785, partial [Candidatus Hydrogenedentes bacterium]|nr:hypothetical protein [Candidatus Hydrogenedentota bacterium]